MSKILVELQYLIYFWVENENPFTLEVWRDWHKIFTIDMNSLNILYFIDLFDVSLC